jgi:hypothetical protein
MLFELGMTRVTPDAQRAIEESAQKPIEFLLRHGNADWGDVEDEEDRLRQQVKITSQVIHR